LLDLARAAVITARAAAPEGLQGRIMLSTADFELVVAAKQREIDRGVRPTLLGLFAEPDPTLGAGEFVVL
jgi:hypothetical protein